MTRSIPINIIEPEMATRNKNTRACEFTNTKKSEERRATGSPKHNMVKQRDGERDWRTSIKRLVIGKRMKAGDVRERRMPRNNLAI